jgi:signal transduction histidine kinase
VLTGAAAPAIRRFPEIQATVILSIAGIGLLVGVGVGFLLRIRYVHRSLAEFARAADAVDGEDLAYRITWNGPAEFAPFVDRFNSMLERLEATTVTKRRLEHGDAAVRAANQSLNTEIAARAEMLKVVENAAQAWRRTFDAVDFVLLTVDRSGKVQRVNRSALLLLGGRFDDWIGRPLSQFPAHQPWLAANSLVGEVIADSVAHRAQVDEDKVWELACTGFGSSDEFCVLWARDVTKTVELQRAVLRSEAMGAMGELLAGVAHEVRNPLFAITALLDAWSLQPGVQQVPFLQMLRQEVMRMRQLMEELLEYGRPFSSQLVLGDLQSVAAEAVSILDPACKARGLSIRADVSGRVRMDRARMLRVFLNLLQNAIDHSDTGATIEVESRLRPNTKPGMLDIFFRDHGKGFMAADLPKVFNPFFTRRPGGTGLGLPIVHRIVEEHGGAITAGNHAEGGALITVQLPLVEEADVVPA